MPRPHAQDVFLNARLQLELQIAAWQSCALLSRASTGSIARKSSMRASGDTVLPDAEQQDEADAEAEPQIAAGPDANPDVLLDGFKPPEVRAPCQSQLCLLAKWCRPWLASCSNAGIRQNLMPGIPKCQQNQAAFMLRRCSIPLLISQEKASTLTMQPDGRHCWLS